MQNKNVVRETWLNKYKTQYTHHNLMIENPSLNDVLSPFSIGSALSLSRAQKLKFLTATAFLRTQMTYYLSLE